LLAIRASAIGESLLQTGRMELRRVEVDGKPVRYRVVGRGEDLVMLHGLSGSWRWWSPLVEKLAGRSRLHLVQLPRLGRLRAGEMAAWLGGLLDAVELGPVDVLGHSLGGLVATELAMEQPDRVRRLVLVAPAGVPCGRGVLGRALPLVEELYDVRRQLPTIVGDAVRTGPVSLVHGIAYVWERDVRGELGAVRAPTLLVWGNRDRLVPGQVAEEWQRLLPRSRLVRLACGHVPMWEAPRELASCVLGFLGEQLLDDPGEQFGMRVGDGVRLTGDDDEAAAR
jgi:pimeloyl-ACP methyl ester carboxylesterase